MSDGTVTFKVKGVSDTGEILFGSREVQAIMQSTVNGYEKRIAEFEKRLSNAETMGSEEQAKRDLEQQVKSLSEFAESLLFRDCLENTFERHDVLERIKDIKGGAE